MIPELYLVLPCDRRQQLRIMRYITLKKFRRRKRPAEAEPDGCAPGKVIFCARHVLVIRGLKIQG